MPNYPSYINSNTKPCVDTNILLPYSNEVFTTLDNVHIFGYVLGELDNLKKNGKTEEVKLQARQATRDIEKFKSKITYVIDETDYNLPSCYDKNVMDNKIISLLNELHSKDNGYYGLSNDLLFRAKCKALNIPCVEFECNKEDESYKGYQELSGNTDFINNLFDDISKGKNDYGFVVNEYLTLHNTDLKAKPINYRFDGKKFVSLKLPDSKVIKGMNNQQRFALDLLGNKDIPIKVIAGGFGSGKTILSVKSGLDQVTGKEIYKTLMFVRNPLPADGTDIGFLPGSKDEKIYDYCRPFLQYIEDPNNQYYAENLIRNEKIKMDVVSFLKGISIDDSYVIMDEAEDLNTKLIKLVGSRIGDTSCVVFTGDWKQAENKYKQDNGLLKLIKKGKGNELVGIVVLDEDVRSPASKFFADL